MFGANSGPLKYFKKLNVYKNSTGTCLYNVSEKKAYSYNHWLFVKEHKGKIIFNDYSYSPTTNRHQRQVRNLLSVIGVKIDYIVHWPESLERVEISYLNYLYDKMYYNTWMHKNASCKTKTKDGYLNSVRWYKKQIETYKKLGFCSPLSLADVKYNAFTRAERDEKNKRETNKKIYEEKKHERLIKKRLINEAEVAFYE